MIPYLSMLKLMLKHLNENGSILIAIENKTGLKYWNGAFEDHTSRQYDGLNDYIGENTVRTFSRREIEQMFESVGVNSYQFLYPVPDYKLPDTIFSDEILPGPGDFRTYGKDYQSSRIYIFLDSVISDQICCDNMFSYFSNSYAIVVGKETNVKYAKYNRERKKDYQTRIEEIENELHVFSSALCKQAQNHIDSLLIKAQKWNGTLPNVHMLMGTIVDSRYDVPYIEGVILQEEFYFERNNLNAFINRVQEYIEEYLRPDQNKLVDFSISDEFRRIFGEYNIVGEKTTAITNIDATFSNLIRGANKEVFCIDPEWIFDFPIPSEYPIWRALDMLRSQYLAYLKPVIGFADFMEKCGITKEKHEAFSRMERNFLNYVYGEGDCEKYTKRYKKNAITQSIRVS